MKNKYEVYTRSSIKDFKQEQWDQCNALGNVFLSYKFLYLLETSKSISADVGWIPIYFAVEEKGELIAVVPCFIKSHSQGEFVFDHAWAQAYSNLGLSYYPKLVVASPFSPVTGMRFLLRFNEDIDLKRILINSIKNYAKENDISSIHINFFDKSELKNFKDEGFIIRYGEQFHFSNDNYNSFDNFLEKLSYKSRKKIIKERKSILDKGISIEVINEKNLDVNICKKMYEFYLSTIHKKWSYNYLSKDFFLGLPEYLNENTLIIIAKYSDNIIAGALNFISNNKLYGRYWGCNQNIPNLHFEVCYYKAIELAINNNYYSVEAGAQGAHKIKRGYLPKLTYSAHYIFNDTLKEAILNFTEEEKKLVTNDMKVIEENYSPFKTT